MKVAELQALAASLGIPGASKLRKGELVAAINDNAPEGDAPGAAEQTSAPSNDSAPNDSVPTEQAPTGSGFGLGGGAKGAPSAEDLAELQKLLGRG